MKIALLICDQVNEDLLHIQGGYSDMFLKLFPQIDFEVFNVFKGQFPANANDFDAYLTNGSRRSVYDKEDWIDQLKAFVRDIYSAQKKYVGVCFGHQLLAEALGGKVAKAASGWSVGVHQFILKEKESWMTPFHQKLNLLMMCQDQVQVLPLNSKVLAVTKTCPVGMFQVGSNMLGIQAHPEFSKAYDNALMELRNERIGTEVVKKGKKSLKKSVDREIIAQWIFQFLNY